MHVRFTNRLIVPPSKRYLRGCSSLCFCVHKYNAANAIKLQTWSSVVWEKRDGPRGASRKISLLKLFSMTHLQSEDCDEPTIKYLGSRITLMKTCKQQMLLFLQRNFIEYDDTAAKKWMIWLQFIIRTL